MRGKWLVYGLVGWLPGVGLAPLDAVEELHRRELPPVVRAFEASVAAAASEQRAEATDRQGRSVEGRQFLVWDEDPGTAEQWAAELRPFDR